MQDALSALLSLSQQDKEARGLIDTPREIQQQPGTWRSTLHRLASLHDSLQGFLDSFGLAHGAGTLPIVILTGAGTSDYIGRALRDILNIEVRGLGDPGHQLLTSMDDIILDGRPYLMISFSRSGESSEGVAVLEQALRQYPDQIRHLIVTCNASTLASFRRLYHQAR